jgi:hypothetical protein
MNILAKAGKASVAKEKQAVKKKEKIERVGNMLRGSVGEPTTAEATYSVDLPMALNWYGLHEEDRVMRKWLSSYLIANGKREFLKAVDKAWDVEVKAVCVLVRLMARDQYVSDQDKAFIDTRLTFLKEKYTEVVAKVTTDVAKPATVAVPMVSIDQRITDAARKYAAEIDAEIDNFVRNKKSDFSMKSFLLSNSISGAVSKKIGGFYAGVVSELTEALEGKDEQLVEGYSYFSKAELKRFLSFVESIVADCQQQVVAAKATRMPRKRKEKPAGVLVARMQYQKEFAELNMKSVPPTTIIGASELWVYNTKYRRVSVYYAMDRGGLSVRGTTILNYDTSKSETKTLRKPEEFFKVAGKRAMATALKSVKTKGIVPNGRINNETILIGAF